MCCKATGLMLAEKGELEPTLSITKKVLVNWLRQIEGGISEEIHERWEQYAVYTGIARGPINYSRRELEDLGWVDNTPQTSLTTMISQGKSVNGPALSEMALKEPDSWLGKRLLKADQITKVLKEEFMNSQP
eukprot:11239264-Heterocapsa_arctica.AAC.1